MTELQQESHECESVANEHHMLIKMLLAKRRLHIDALEGIDTELSQIQTELSRRIDDALARRQVNDEAVTHLRIEGWSEYEDSEVEGGQAPGSNGKLPIEAAYELLSTRGKPLHYRKLTQELSDIGVHIAGKDPAATLLSKMSRDIRFKRAPERGEYGLAVWQMRKRSTKKRKAKRSKNRSQ